MTARRTQPVQALLDALPDRPVKATFRVPALWDCWGFQGKQARIGGEVLVDPVAYLEGCLAWVDAQATVYRPAAYRSLSKACGVRPVSRGKVRDAGTIRRGGDWIACQTMYGMMVRTSSSWDHDGDGRLEGRRWRETGTFVKSILLLPLLKRMGITVLYLLPVVKTSRLFRKGELGCPYSARNFFELDPDLRDPLVDANVCDVEAQFAALIACAHRLGMRVMLDVAPRTAARDNDWILDHPDWFYWIDVRCQRRYAAPALPEISYRNPIPRRLGELYRHPAVQAHLAMFRFAPSITHPKKWKRFVAQAKARPPANLVREIGKHFGLITPPAFSDVMNDPQPPWSDVTFLRLFLDHPIASARQLSDPKRQPPYVLFDTIKASVFEGRRPNRALWRKLADIIPFYQRFGIDGARVDMAHALPTALERMVLAAPRRRDPDFCFLAEDLGSENHAAVRRAGYNVMIGPSWTMQPRGHEGQMHELLDELPRLKVPTLAAAETPDTPRAVTRRGGRRFSRMCAVVNHFLPNSVLLLHSGVEVFERQPANLGLDNIGPGRHALPADDPQAGKLAFFDRYALHWDNRGGRQMVELLARTAALRQSYIDTLADPRAHFVPELTPNRRFILATGFRLGRGRGSLLMLANLDCGKAHRIGVSLDGKRTGSPEVLLELCATKAPGTRGGKLSVTLPPGDVKIIRI